jgi:bacillithiol system protein YtxJ
MMNWIALKETAQLEQIKEKSKDRPQVIFKHSTRCSASQLVKNRLERNTTPPEIDFYFLDLISCRQVSNKIAEVFQVYHESPQVLLIKNGECVYDESHLSIDMNEILDQVSMN